MERCRARPFAGSIRVGPQPQQSLHGCGAAKPHGVVQRRHTVLIAFVDIGPGPNQSFDGDPLPIGIGIPLAADIGQSADGHRGNGEESQGNGLTEF